MIKTFFIYFSITIVLTKLFIINMFVMNKTIYIFNLLHFLIGILSTFQNICPFIK